MPPIEGLTDDDVRKLGLIRSLLLEADEVHETLSRGTTIPREGSEEIDRRIFEIRTHIALALEEFVSWSL
jgi:hypothetical protein